MRKYSKITPEGTRDLLFEECRVRRSVETTLAQVFNAHGFNEVVTPGLEFYDVFAEGSAPIPQEIMYKLTDHRGRLMVLRPDSTMPIARLTATRLQNQPKPIRLYYTQPVYRSNPSLTGRSDEVVQAGIELLGAGGRRADIEAITLAIEALGSCETNFRIELGHAGFFKALAQQLSIAEDVYEDIRISIESKNYAALNSILEGLNDTPAAKALSKLPRLFGGEEVFAEAAALCEDTQTTGILNYLHDLYTTLSGLGLGDKLIIDLGLVHRNDYYSGTVFSGYVEGSGDAVLSGGRYDNLLASFGAPMPAIGFAVNVDALAKIQLTKGGAQHTSVPDVLVHGDSGYEIKAFRHASALSKTGLQCENSIFDSREEALTYAKERSIARVDFISDTIDTVGTGEV